MRRTVEGFRKYSPVLSDTSARRRFGSWSKALKRAGLELSPNQRRWTDDDYFENLLTVWTYYGRPPTYAEMNKPPSRISKWHSGQVRYVDEGEVASSRIGSGSVFAASVGISDGRPWTDATPARRAGGVLPAPHSERLARHL